jgi:formylglycine-generating enzyme required for sulfatase activity
MRFIGKVALWALTRGHDRRDAMQRPHDARERPGARRRSGLALIALALALSAAAAAQAAPTDGRRVALVIGNDEYQHIDKLQKAKADANAYAAVLREKGFLVQEGYDLSMLDMSSAVADFVQKINPGDTAVFVYSGHGWSDGAHNYLVGVDVPGRATEELLTRLSLPLRNGVDGVLDDLERKNAGLKAAIIDACRDNPFRPPPGERGYALARGLKPQSVEGSFIVYSAGEGQSAMDRLSDADSDPNSVFTRTFLPLLSADLPLRDAIKASQAKTHALAAAADHDQTPAYYDEVLGEACLSATCEARAGALKTTQTANLTAGAPTAIDSAPPDEAVDAMIDATTNADLLAALIPKLPDGPLKERAKARAEALKATTQTAIVIPPPSVALPPSAAISVGPPLKIAANDSGGEVFKECDECPEMVVVPAGKALLGSPLGESGRQTFEAAPHTVEIARPFAVGRYAVTFAQWDACFAEGGCGRRRLGDLDFGRGKRPAIFATWTDAQLYVQWLKRKTGQPYRLLSEAEWEYAARGCKSLKCDYAPFWFGAIKPELAVYDSRRSYNGSPKAEARLKTEPVDNGPPNPFGLYNMLGNVRQWTQDCWNPTPAAVASNGAPVLSGDCDSRATRGGSWADDPAKLRASARDYESVDEQSERVGFRVARDLEP